jgi:hypothetical protein
MSMWMILRTVLLTSVLVPSQQQQNCGPNLRVLYSR